MRVAFHPLWRRMTVCEGWAVARSSAEKSLVGDRQMAFKPSLSFSFHVRSGSLPLLLSPLSSEPPTRTAVQTVLFFQTSSLCASGHGFYHTCSVTMPLTAPWLHLSSILLAWQTWAAPWDPWSKAHQVKLFIAKSSEPALLFYYE